MNVSNPKADKTSRLAGKAFAHKLISSRVLERLQDGTVSNHDLREAKQLAAEQTAIYAGIRENYDDTNPEHRKAQRRMGVAQRLYESIASQHHSQGFVETTAESAKDAYYGKNW